VSAVSFLISRQGDAKLAAIDATRELGHEVTAAQLLTVISGDPQAATLLGQQARVLVMLRMLEAFKLLDMAFKAAIPALQPRDAARAYTDLASSLAQVAPPSTAPPSTHSPPYSTSCPPKSGTPWSTSLSNQTPRLPSQAPARCSATRGLLLLPPTRAAAPCPLCSPRH
jgi:hypothetical protein